MCCNSCNIPLEKVVLNDTIIFLNGSEKVKNSFLVGFGSYLENYEFAFLEYNCPFELLCYRCIEDFVEKKKLGISKYHNPFDIV